MMEGMEDAESMLSDLRDVVDAKVDHWWGSDAQAPLEEIRDWIDAALAQLGH